MPEMVPYGSQAPTHVEPSNVGSDVPLADNAQSMNQAVDSTKLPPMAQGAAPQPQPGQSDAGQPQDDGQTTPNTALPYERPPTEVAQAKHKAEVDDALTQVSASVPVDQTAKADSQLDDTPELMAAKLKSELFGGGDALGNNADPREGFVSQIMDGAKNLFVRAQAGLGRNDDERLNIFKAALGDENVRLKDGEVQIRLGAGKKFKPADENTLTELSPTMRLVGFLADHSGAVLQGGVQAGVTAGADAAMGATSLGAGSVVGAPLANQAGAIAGPLAGAGALRALSAAYNKDLETADLKNEMLWSMGLSGAFQAAPGVLSYGADKLKGLASEALDPILRIQALAGIKKQFADIASNIGTHIGGLKGALDNTFGIVDDISRSLEGGVALVRDKAEELGGDTKFETPNVLKALKEELENQGVKFDPKTGFAKPLKEIPSYTEMRSAHLANQAQASRAARTELSFEDLVDSNPALREDAFASRSGFSLNPSDGPLFETLAEQSKPFGNAQGRGMTGKLIEDHNILKGASDTGNGVDVSTLFDYVKDYQNRSGFGRDEALNNVQNAVFKRLQHAAGSDRNSALENIFEGSNEPEALTWKDHLDAFHQNIDAVQKLKSIAHDPKSASSMAEALIHPNNANQIKDLKGLFGKDDPDWNKLRGEFISKQISEATDPVSGILDAGKLISKIHSLGDETRNEILSPDEWKSMVKVARDADKIDWQGLTGAQKSHVNTVINLFKGFNGTTRIKAMLHFIGRNADAGHYLNNQAFLDAASYAETRTVRNQILRFAHDFRQAMSQMQTITVGGKKVLVPVARAALTQGAMPSGDESMDVMRSQILGDGVPQNSGTMSEGNIPSPLSQ